MKHTDPQTQQLLDRLLLDDETTDFRTRSLDRLVREARTVRRRRSARRALVLSLVPMVGLLALVFGLLDGVSTKQTSVPVDRLAAQAGRSSPFSPNGVNSSVRGEGPATVVMIPFRPTRRMLLKL